MMLTVQQAGKIGGLTTSKKMGREFYVHIGRKGQEAVRRKYPNMARIWGRMGGRPRRPTLAEIMGEEGQILKNGG